MAGDEESVEEAAAEMHRLHGRAVSDAAELEFHILLIALAYHPETRQLARRCWNEAVKPILQQLNLTESLQAEMADVSNHFDARNSVAHRFVLLSTGPSKTWRIMRYWIEDGHWHMHQIGFDELRDEVERIRAGRDAARLIFAAVHELDPAPFDVSKRSHGHPWRS